MPFDGTRSPEIIAKVKETNRRKMAVRNELVYNFLAKNPGERTSREIIAGTGLRYYQIIGAINILEDEKLVSCRRPGQIGANKPKLFVTALPWHAPSYAKAEERVA